MTQRWRERGGHKDGEGEEERVSEKERELEILTWWKIYGRKKFKTYIERNVERERESDKGDIERKCVCLGVR